MAALSKGLVTHGTFVRVLSTMGTLVHLEIGGVAKGPVTQVALVRPVTGMDAYVGLEMARPTEVLVTYMTPVKLHTEVNSPFV